MEKFTNIAESILNLWDYEDYKLMRLDIQYHPERKEMFAWATYSSDVENRSFDVKIFADGTFTQV